MTVDRILPQNIEAEQSVLGSLLMDPKAIITVASFLESKDFERGIHGDIYGAMIALHERREAIDLVTVSDELERRGGLEGVGGVAYLTSLFNMVPTSVHVEHYAHIVERTSTLRKLIDAAGQIAGLAYQEAGTVEEIIDKAEAALFRVSQERVQQSLTPIAQVVTEYYEHIEYLHQHQGESIGLPTGFVDLDRLLNGLQKSDLIIVAGRPAMGKTSFGLALARHAALKQRAVVAIFTLEMAAQQLVQRLVSSETSIDSQRLQTGRIQDTEWDAFVHASNLLAESAIFIDDTASPTPLEIRTKCRRLSEEHGLDLIIIDYLQLMQGSRRTENRVQEISNISRALKGLARELNVPVLALSQLSRAVESRDDKHPRLSDLRESGSIEQDADIVMFIYRDEVYNEHTDLQNIAEIVVSKHRNGPTGAISLRFRKELVRFENLALAGDFGDDYDPRPRY
jgi:replicative DNA helicase